MYRVSYLACRDIWNKTIRKESNTQCLTSAMRQAGNPSSVDRLRMRERFRFQKNISGQKPRPAHSRETLWATLDDTPTDQRTQDNERL